MTSTDEQRPYRVGRSNTGLGLFATAPIKKGAFIIEYMGPKLTNEEVEKRTSARYLFEVSSKWTIDGSPRSNIARYINHSCRPNAEPFISRGVIRIKAARNIQPDEEITYNYGKAYFDEFIGADGCKCTACVRKRALKRAKARAEKANGAKANGAKAKRAKADGATTNGANAKRAKANGVKAKAGKAAKAAQGKSAKAKAGRAKVGRAKAANGRAGRAGL